MLFPLRQSNITGQNQAVPFPGGQTSFQIPRDFFLDSLMIEISGTVSTAAATASADGILGVVKNIQLQIADGSSNRVHTNVSGVSAIQKAFLLTGSIDQSTLNAFEIGTGTGTFVI